ncbi:hypothetical protein JHK82_050454 [Glycine max]|nr:hypothetical protein JHK85_051096 [Glycine max]KAG5091676.1 hypothetical protein JHK82_050454 [Glycine max]
MLSERHYYKEDAGYYLPSTSGDAWNQNENEDIDHAISLSLVEESESKQQFINNAFADLSSIEHKNDDILNGSYSNASA